MHQGTAGAPGSRLKSDSGLRVELTTSGAIRRFDCGDIAIGLFVGNELEGSVGNLYLRRLGRHPQHVPLLGPSSPTSFRTQAQDGRIVGHGQWGGLRYGLSLVLASRAAAWFWHLRIENASGSEQCIDLTYAQDLGLAPYGAVRLNEFYVSQYLDHTPLRHAERGLLIATRQNQAAAGRNAWTLVGSLRSGVSFATDALQFHGLATRDGRAPAGMTGELPSLRLQHEHSLAVIRDEPIHLAAGACVDAGFFGGYWHDHPQATSDDDLPRVAELLGLPEAAAPAFDFAPAPADIVPPAASLFTTAPRLAARPLDTAQLRRMFAPPWRHEEFAADGERLSFFHDETRHVVLPAKERATLRPHGHLLRSGRHLTPDESALTSTAWMAGVFHSMLTQGHVSINRMLSTVHGYLGLFRSHGQRVFVEVDGAWQLLDLPSAFEMAPDACQWIYRHDQGELCVRAQAHSDPHELSLSIDVIAGPPLRCLISHHVALNGDDGSTRGAARWRREGEDIVVTAAPDSDVGRRFPQGSFRIAPGRGTRFERVAGDEALFLDGRSREEPFLCIQTAPGLSMGLSIRGHLVAEDSQAPLHVAIDEPLIPRIVLQRSSRAASDADEALARLADIAPWFTHNALVHYLSPRGLEQYSGGGWGTRDVTQGPVEMLLALDRLPAVRDLLLRVMRQQNADGDWPQWFMFFERERNIRPGDSHGDIVFWPLLVLGQYLVASGDRTLLDERIAYFDGGEPETIWQHALRALAVVDGRVIRGTALAAYGHGDWNDSLQPADPVMRERLCSAWTVTLHVQTLETLGRGLRAVDRGADATALERRIEPVRRDFQTLLIADGVLAGYALFEDPGARPGYLLHPRDTRTGVRYSALAMIHAILEDLFTPEQTRRHLQLLDTVLSGPDGVRLFDRPLPYHGGPQRLFQRAESATYFGREIGLMYTHAHLRYAQALAHVGDAERFFRALCQANPIGIRSIVPSATLRQANCYYSSSDAAFDDRYQASTEYHRVAQGSVALEGGWRVYSSGAGIALGLIVRRFLGLGLEWNRLSLDPVMPATLDGLRVQTRLLERPIEIAYALRGGGCGVKKVVLNGQALQFALAPNPHRPGAALVDRAQVRSLLLDRANVLQLEVG